MKQGRDLQAVLWAGWASMMAGLLLAGCAREPGLPTRKATEAYAQGVIAYNDGNLPVAKTHLGAATQESPELIKARLLLGDLFRSEGNYKSALFEYETVVKLDPYSPGGFYRLGVVYQFLQRFLEARDAYGKALTLRPDDVDSHMNLGLVHLALGDVAQAMEHSRRAVELAPENATALANFGVVQDAIGDPVGAEKSLLRSLEISGDNPATLLNLGQVLLTQNRPREAQEILARLLQKTDSPIGRKRLADALALQGMAADAIQEYEKALRLDPNYFPAMNDAGKVMIGRYRAGAELDESLREIALQYWHRSLRINPSQPQIQALIKQWERRKP